MFVNDDIFIFVYFKEVKIYMIKKVLMGKDIYMCYCFRKVYMFLFVIYFVFVIINLCYIGEIVIVFFDMLIL